MRAMDDPMMSLFNLYPLVVACTAAIVFNTMKSSLNGTPAEKGFIIGAILICIMIIPRLYVMDTPITRPADFSVITGIWEIISFPLTGICFARIGKI
jgi:hypothetical protein